MITWIKVLLTCALFWGLAWFVYRSVAGAKVEVNAPYRKAIGVFIFLLLLATLVSAIGIIWSA